MARILAKALNCQKRGRADDDALRQMRIPASRSRAAMTWT